MSAPEPVAAYPAPRATPRSYPGRRPPGSFVVAGLSVHPLRPARGPSSMRRLELDDFLRQRGAAPMRERFAVIGYGSNPVPGQLIDKLGRDAVVPVAAGRLRGADVVYNLASNFGYAYAELLVGDGLGDCAVGVTFLDRAQLARMAESEQNYRLAHSPRDVVLESGELLRGGAGQPLYVFAGFRRLWVPEGHDAPVAVAEIETAGRTLVAMTQAQYLKLAIERFGLARQGIATPEALSATLLAQAPLAEAAGKLKSELQAAVDGDPRSFPPLIDAVVPVDENAVQPLQAPPHFELA